MASGLAAYHALALLNPYLAAEARHYMNYLRGKYLKQSASKGLVLSDN
jgi:hypothetical protein